MDFNKIFQSKTFKYVLYGIGALIVLLIVFRLGMAVGFKKAGFSYSWGESYHRNFGGPRGGFLKDFAEDSFINGYGTVGRIMKVGSSTIVMRGQDNVEKIVLVKDTTSITRNRETIKSVDLKVDDYIVVIGDPNNTGQVDAKFIRVMLSQSGPFLPPPPPFPPMRRPF